MHNPTPNETSPDSYSSPDGLVSVRVLDQPRRYPDHGYRVAVFRFTPQQHSRIRDLGNNVFEFMPTKLEILAITRAMTHVDPDFKITFERPMINKPEERKLAWQKYNQYRTRRQRYGGYRRFYRRR